MMSFSDYNSITLNGTFLKGTEIEDFCKRKNNDFFLQVTSGNQHVGAYTN